MIHVWLAILVWIMAVGWVLGVCGALLLFYIMRH